MIEMRYWTLPDDGAKFRCHDCKEEFPNDKVIIYAPFKVTCLGCMDEDWMARARCAGEAGERNKEWMKLLREVK